jgi:vacuolar-type H+-ATPase subunit F/Vma7
MERLRNALEALDETIFDLEHKVGIEKTSYRETVKKQSDIVKQIRTREAGLMAVTQKVASRLDQAIEHVERIIRH